MANNNFYQYPTFGYNGYNNGYNQNYQQQNYQPQQYIPQVQQQYQQYQTQQPQGLNGKIVESCDIVKATEIPMNGYGIFPQADMSHVYIKTWNNDGTTKILDYIPVVVDNDVKNINGKYTEIINDVYTSILNSIANLEKKIDAINVKCDIKQDEVKKSPTSIRKKVSDDAK